MRKPKTEPGALIRPPRISTTARGEVEIISRIVYNEDLRRFPKSGYWQNSVEPAALIGVIYLNITVQA